MLRIVANLSYMQMTF